MVAENKITDVASGFGEETEASVPHVHVAILGAGFAGLGMAIRLKQRGVHDFTIIEQAADLGGTWRDNIYPGCACDIPSHLYSFSFASNPHWSRMYSPQSEIQKYLQACAERFDILPHIRWNSELINASWNDDEQQWSLTTAQGKLLADIFILGQGPLNQPSLPAIPGIERFAGELFHSSQWKYDYDLTDKRVAVIGTGASAIQFIPHIQPRVSRLLLFQRTPPWILPRMDHAVPAWQQTMFRLLPFTQRLIRARMYWQRELTALAFIHRPGMLKSAMRLSLSQLNRHIADPRLRVILTPQYTMGCKRVLLSDDFYPAIAQPNIEVITDRISEIREHSIVTDAGQEHEVEAIICGTGFHINDTQLPRLVYGRDGQQLAEKWKDGPSAYLGTSVAGFPNLFLLIGPNTGLGHNSMIFMIEAQITYILDCLRTMRHRSAQTVEVQAKTEETFKAEMRERTVGTVWASGCKSWYLDTQGRNTALWPGFTFEFRRRTRHFDPQHYLLTAHARTAVPMSSEPGRISSPEQRAT